MGDQILNPKNIAIKRLQEENEKLHDKCKRLEKRVFFFSEKRCQFSQPVWMEK